MEVLVGRSVAVTGAAAINVGVRVAADGLNGVAIDNEASFAEALAVIVIWVGQTRPAGTDDQTT